jgi:hypothetical protein
MNSLLNNTTDADTRATKEGTYSIRGQLVGYIKESHTQATGGREGRQGDRGWGTLSYLVVDEMNKCRPPLHQPIHCAENYGDDFTAGRPRLLHHTEAVKYT